LKPAWSWQFDPATLQPVCGVAADSDHLGDRLTGRGIVLAGVITRIPGKHPELTPFQMKTVLMT
jgi:hypothetical protein